MSFFQGLYSYEIIMLCLGSLISLLLIIDLIIKIIRQRNYTKTITAFFIPVLLIGFPSIQKISYDNGKIDFEKLTHNLNSNPTDTSVRKEVESKITQLKSRADNDPKTLTAIASAHWSLGNYDSCQVYAQKAISLAPNDTSIVNDVNAIQKKIDLHNNFKAAISKINDYLNEATNATVNKNILATNIAKTLDTLKKPQYISQADLIVLSKAYVALNRRAKAVEIAHKAASADSNSGTAKEVNENAETKMLNVKPLVDTSAHIKVRVIDFDQNIVSKKNFAMLKNVKK